MRPTQKTPAYRQSPCKQLANLGDTDTEIDDDEPETFRTPSTLPELTDYELNYSAASPGPPRRSSTLRKETSIETRSARKNRVDNEDDEDTNDNSDLLASVASMPTNQKSLQRRKQLTPIRREQQREQKFLLDVRKLQMRTDFLIPRLPFSLLIREIMVGASDSIRRISRTALEALQTSAEMYLEQRLHDAYLLTLHRGRVTLEVRDLILINFLRQYSN